MNHEAQCDHKKLVLTAMLACLAFVLNTFVYFPAMAPFQHFVDALAALWYGCAAFPCRALACSLETINFVGVWC